MMSDCDTRHTTSRDSDRRSADLAGCFRYYRLVHERRRRGRAELSRLQRADAVLYSPGNSGRTWLRAMLTRALEQHFGLESSPVIEFDNLHKRDARVPSIAVTHNRWLPYYQKGRASGVCAAYYQKRVLVLVRNPLDTCVSQYFQWKYRSKDEDVALKGWPPRNADMCLLEFLRHPATGLTPLCLELNTWWQESARFEASAFIRYEDMLRDPSGSLEVALGFFGIAPQRRVIDDAVAYCSFDRMRDREVTRGSSIEDSQSEPTTDGDSLKTRSGGTGGYIEYLSAQTRAEFEALVAQILNPAYGYDALPAILPFRQNSHSSGRR